MRPATGDGRIPKDARLCLQVLAAQLDVVKRQILENDRRVLASARRKELGRRLMEIPGVCPLLASAFVASVADPTVFRTGRDLAARIGQVPKQNSSGGKDRIGSITREESRYLRQMLVVGAMAVIRYAQRNGKRRPWLVQLLARRPGGGAGQQERADGLGADDQRRALSRTAANGGVRASRGLPR